LSPELVEGEVEGLLAMTFSDSPRLVSPIQFFPLFLPPRSEQVFHHLLRLSKQNKQYTVTEKGALQHDQPINQQHGKDVVGTTLTFKK
jgi:hypothetical protein